jgi:hypothetical protein
MGPAALGDWGATTGEDKTNDNGELPPARDIHQQGQALNDDGEPLPMSRDQQR